MMSSACTLRLKRRRALSNDSPSCSRTSAKSTTSNHLSTINLVFVLTEGVIPPSQFFFREPMFVALGHNPSGTLEGIDEGRVDACLRHGLDHVLLVLFRIQRYRIFGIGIKKDRVVRARVATKFF